MKFQGKTGLLWFTGVVEDRNDPLFLNRVRVRIYGVHTHDKQFIATPDLPWSEVLMPTTSPSLSGMGTTTHGLVEGSTVMGFWRDDYEMQDPVVMGSFIGIPQKFYRIDETIDDKGTRNFTQIERTTEEGFNDPRLEDVESYEGTPDGPNPEHINRNYGLTLDLKNSPKPGGTTAAVSYPKEDYLGLSDVNLMARVTEDSPMKDAYPIVAEVNGEPARSNYVKPIYPFNHVHETESGHVIELDDTPDAERIHAYHRTGTRVEVDKDGTYVEKIVRDKYTLILGSDTVKIQGAVDIEVGDSLASNAIAASGGAEALAEKAAADIVNEDGTLTDATKANLKEAGVTDVEIADAEKKGEIKEIIVTATKKSLDSQSDEVNETKVDTVIDLVEGVDQGEAGIPSVIDQVSESIGGEGLNDEAKGVITDVLSGGDVKDIGIAKATDVIKDKLDTFMDNSEVVQNIKGKLDGIFEKATASIEGMKAKATEAVTAAVGKVFGEEAAAKVSEQMVGAVTGAAMSAVGGLVGSALVNINVGGSAKIITKGSTSLYSYGSTDVTSLMNTTVTTLTGNTSLTTLMGTTNVTSTVGAVNISAPAGVINANAMKVIVTGATTVGVQAIESLNLRAPKINSLGVWNHTGAMNIEGLTTLTGAAAISGKTEIGGLVTIGGALTIAGSTTGAGWTHTHVIATGSSAGTTGPGTG